MDELGDKRKENSIVSTHFFQAILEVIKKEQEDEIYIKELANKYCLKEPKNYVSVRSIILDIHFRLENCINMAITYYLCFYRKKELSFTKEEVSKILDEIANIDYAKKLKIIERLKIFTSSSITICWKINDLRVAFAHNYKRDSPKYLYYNDSIFKRKSIDKLIVDMRIVIEEFINFVNSL